MAYDSNGWPIFRNIYCNSLLNDALDIGALKKGVFFGLANYLPKHVMAFVEAALCGRIVSDSTALANSYELANPEYQANRKRFYQLRELLKDSTIEPIHGGWIGRAIEDGLVRAFKVTRVRKSGPDNHGSITVEIAFLSIDRWTDKQLEIISASDEYQKTMLWLYTR